MRRLLALFLAAMLLLTGCADKGRTTVSADLYRISLPYENSFFFNELGWDHTGQDRCEDEVLQTAAGGIRVEYPLSTQEQIQTYAQALFDFCTEQGYFPDSLSAVDAMQFEYDPDDPIWLLCYLSPESRLYDAPGPGAYILISGEDGHILHWDYDKTGEGISADIARELYSIQVIARGFFVEDYDLEDRLDNEELQAAAAQIPIQYPLTTDEQLHEYAWALYEICMEEELFPPHLAPQFALFQEDGALRLSFSDLAFAAEGISRYDGEAASFWVSQEDGHIIEMDITLHAD